MVQTKTVDEFSGNPLSACNKRVALIGPILPFRGGIAQHTTMLHRALSRQVCCLTLSFSRQYPSFLFPGTSDRDESLKDFREPGVEYLIDSLNPLTWYKAVKRILTFQPDLVVFPWWQVYWVPCFGWMSRQFSKKGIELVFLCHNVIEHEAASWKQTLTATVLATADRFVVHSVAEKKTLLARFPETNVQVYPHPIYNQFPASEIQLPRRAKLELLFFGFIRPYKGLDVLLKAMCLLKEEDIFLSVVGEFWKGEQDSEEFLKKNNLSGMVELVPRYVSDQEAADYFQRCDLVVLPYRSATGSGVVPLAFHYGKPVIVTSVGGLPDVVEDGVTGTLVEPDSPEQISDAIRAVQFGKVRYDSEKIGLQNKGMSWKGLSDVILS